MSSLSEKVARALYGKSDKANSPENQDPDFQAGYQAGLSDKTGDELISNEWDRRGHVMSEGFTEWKRGMWAAHMQKIEIEHTQ